MNVAIVCWLAAVVAASAQKAAAPPGKPTMAAYKAAKAQKEKAEAEKKATEAKSSLVNKVVDLIQTMKKQVTKANKDELKTYNEFSSYCRLTRESKTRSVKKMATSIAETKATIGQLKSKIALHQKEVNTANAAIKDTQKATTIEKTNSKAAFEEYNRNDADLTAGISSLTQAMNILKSGKSASFLQVQTASSTVDTALSLADAMGLISSHEASHAQIFLQQSQQPKNALQKNQQSSSTHGKASKAVIVLLEKLLSDFKNSKNKIEVAEANRVNRVNMVLQAKTDLLATDTEKLNDNQADMRSKLSKRQAQELTLESDTKSLADDKTYLDELIAGCAAKKVTFNQRQAAQKEETAALDTVIGMMGGAKTKITTKTLRLAQIGSNMRIADAVASDEDDMGALEAEAEDTEAQEAGSPMSFLQMREETLRVKAAEAESEAKSEAEDTEAQEAEDTEAQEAEAQDTEAQEADTPMPDDDNKQEAAMLLKGQGQQLNNAMLLDLATHISSDPMEKVTKMISAKIEELLNSGMDVSLALCTPNIKKATAKSAHFKRQIAEIETEKKEITAVSSTLKDTIAKLDIDMNALKLSMTKAKKTREAEKLANKNEKEAGEAGTKMLTTTITFLDRFYKTAANKVKNDAKATFQAKAEAKAKAKASGKKNAFQNAPDAGFETEDTKGASSEAGGILGMMEVIKSDFERSAKQAVLDDVKSEEEFYAFITETTIALKQKKIVRASKNEQKVDVDTIQTLDVDTRLKNEKMFLKNKKAELKALKVKCRGPEFMTYDEKVAKREAEIKSLNAAWELLDNRKSK